MNTPPTEPFAGYPRPAGPPQLRLEMISEAFNVLKRDFGTWVAMALIAFLILVAVNFGLSLPLNLIFGEPGTVGMGAVFGLGGVFGPGQTIVTVIGWVVQFIVGTGLMWAALKQLRGMPIGVNDMFEPMSRFPQLAIAGIVYGLATTVGFILCCLPGFLVSGLLMFTGLLIMDKGMDAMDALRTSFEALKGQAAMAFLFFLTAAFVAAIGFVLCCVGLLFTYPIYVIAIAIAYREFFDRLPTAGMVPPGAVPNP
jgi:uncharacterized membrane protein